MADSSVKLKLETLLDLLRQEREAAMSLDMERLQEIVVIKEELLVGFDPQAGEIVGLEDLLKQVDHENRRNAFLLWTGLNWVRDLMGFFGKASMPQVYGGGGQSQSLNQPGRLLSGKV